MTMEMKFYVSHIERRWVRRLVLVLSTPFLMLAVAPSVAVWNGILDLIRFEFDLVTSAVEQWRK